jgi:hypothetical protein
MLGRSRVVPLVLAASASLAVNLGPAQAVITEPIPDNPPAGPPPLPALPVADETPPPTEVIGDPMEPAAGCSGWYPQSNYAGIWPAGSTWWEYECSLAEVQYPSCSGLPGVMCEQGYTIWGSPWTDRFYWDGSQPVFLGENSQLGCEYWWDAPTAQWYAFVTPDCPAPSSPSPPPPPPNAPPTAGFSVSCAGVGCDFDGSGSADTDGTVAPVTGLTARGYKQKGAQKVELSWINSSGGGYDVLRDGTRIGTVAGASYTDSFDRRSSGTYRYQVCVAGSQICSIQATVNF